MEKPLQSSVPPHRVSSPDLLERLLTVDKEPACAHGRARVGESERPCMRIVVPSRFRVSLPVRVHRAGLRPCLLRACAQPCRWSLSLANHTSSLTERPQSPHNASESSRRAGPSHLQLGCHCLPPCWRAFLWQ